MYCGLVCLIHWNHITYVGDPAMATDKHGAKRGALRGTAPSPVWLEIRPRNTSEILQTLEKKKKTMKSISNFHSLSLAPPSVGTENHRTCLLGFRFG